MNDNVHEALLWSLRALAQDANTQHGLYPYFVPVPDELVLEFDDALAMCGPEYLQANPDLAALDDLIDSKGGQSEYWSDAALEESDFWQEIRNKANQALRLRGWPTTAPEPYEFQEIEENPGWLDRIVAWVMRKR